MKYFSTFTGIGGFEIGIHNAYRATLGRSEADTARAHETGEGLVATPGQDTSSPDRRPGAGIANFADEGPLCVGYSEIDKYASSVYEYQFGGKCENCRLARKRERDSSTSGRQETVNGERTRLSQTLGNNDDIKNEWSESDNECTCPKNYGDITKINASELPDFDFLVGGFPCQAFSIAGKRQGFQDTRGTLFFDLARILKAKQPPLFVFENVKGLLSHDQGRALVTIISAIDDLGYDCQWQVLNSKNFGVPQNRERIIIVGHLRGTPRPEVFPITGNNSQDIVQINQPIHSNDRIYGDEGLSPTLNTMQGGRRQPLIVSQNQRREVRVREEAGALQSSRSSSQFDVVYVPEATKKGYAEARVGQSINLAVPNSKTRCGRVSDVAQTIDTTMQQHTLTKDAEIRKLTPIECERLQGFPDNWTAFGRDGEPISDTQRYKMAGNAVTTNVIQAVFERIFQSVHA